MSEHTRPVVIAARRTPISTRGMRLRGRSVHELAAPVIRRCLADAERAIGSSLAVGDVVLGNCMGPGGNIARLSALAADLDVSVPGMTIDRQCGSGLSAIITASDAIRAGDSRLLLAGGAESASTAPLRIAHGVPYARAAFSPTGFPDPEMGPAAQELAAAFGIDRDRQDAYAERSHRLALVQLEAGGFDNELVALDELGRDDSPRERMTDLLPRFPSLYPTLDGPATGSVTAGNSCRISDGAAVVAIVSTGSRGDAPGLALLAHATIGCDPALPGIGPVAAVNQVLAAAGVSLDDIAAFEIVEAFAAQSLAVLYSLDLATPDFVDPRVCSGGGALALGHPWGASGAVSVVRLFTRLVREGAPAGSLGIATAAVGGGMGVAALFEVVR
ncbi:thiolase family protein [Glaciihabitans sp. GrIS 2.15]|uniref:thiolase family protein n=1 Tax=Glaciihabitans sp. GrIS 2.15 TaxID=3071710 RepID=UPI002E049197|nr:acetyl-CoA C-acetyltransferase [Glaciihabitans sp. GrIS 2.15]